MSDHIFISYSTADGLDFARQLADELEGGEDVFIDAWLDKRDIKPGRDWEEQLVEGIKTRKCMAFVMTEDSTAATSMCKNEWTWALKHKKPVVPIRLHKAADQPFGLGNRQWIDFTGEFQQGLAKLRKFLRGLDSPTGILQTYKDRLADPERALRRAQDAEAQRIQAEIEDLKKQIETQQKIVDNPQAAEEQTKKNIETGLARERHPEKPVAAKTTTKFINPPPGIAPTYFQDRFMETRQVVDFLQDDAQTLMTVVGRGGVGKTAMVCRLLKALERGELPDELGKMSVDGIIYLSENGSHPINFGNIFYDLCQLLSGATAQALDAVYKNPQASTESKICALLEHFTDGRVLLLLDNFEPLVDPETQAITDDELDAGLRAFLNGTHTAVNILITARVAPRAVNLVNPGRQRILTLDEGLESPYAENILREMDRDGSLGLQAAPEAVLARARQRTRGYPRALEALAAILAADRYTTLEELLEMPTPENVVEALVGEAFNRLDANAQQVMQALAVYHRPVTPAAVDYLLAPHRPAVDSAPILQRLANMHFARKERGKFYLHPVDREFAFSLTPNPAPGGSGESSAARRGEGDAFTQQDLTLRAADYFKQARKPRAEWKKLADLNAQLAEFDLRCAAGDFDTAADVLTDIDFDYLLLWGHYHLMISLHLKVQDKIKDKNLAMGNLNGLGLAHYTTGKIRESILFYEQGLEIAREAKDQGGEGAFLGNLGLAYADLGETQKAIDYYEQALAIFREIGDRRGAGADLGNLGNALSVLNDFKKAKLMFTQAIQIADEILYAAAQLEWRRNLARNSLFQNDLQNAYNIIEIALQYDVPQYTYKANLLKAIIALRQGDVETAQAAFGLALAQAEEMLAKTPELYSALDAKGLALCGAALCAADDGRQTADRETAIEAFRKAREIAPQAGVVQATLRLFDELAKCDAHGILAGVRAAAEAHQPYEGLKPS